MSADQNERMGNAATPESDPAPSVAIILPGKPGRRKSASTTGSELRYWEPMLMALADAGLRVTFYANLINYRSERIQIRPITSRFIGVPIKRAGYSPGVMIVSPSLAIHLRKQQFDLILIIEYNMSVIWSIIATWRTATRVAIFQEHQRSDSSFMRLVRRFMAQRSSLVIGNTKAACAEVINDLGIPRDKVAHIPLLMAPPRSYLCRQPISLPEVAHRPLFLCVSRLVPLKNIGLLLTASDILHKRGHKFTVWIVGAGPMKDALIAQRDRYGLQGIVEFIGEIPYESIGFAYQACDVYVLPTYNDYRSVSVLEAMRFGKPILDSSGDGNAGDLVRHGDNGFIFDPGNPEELADHMAALISQADLRERMGIRSAEIAKRFDPQRSAKLFAEWIRGTSRRQGERKNGWYL